MDFVLEVGSPVTGVLQHCCAAETCPTDYGIPRKQTGRFTPKHFSEVRMSDSRITVLALTVANNNLPNESLLDVRQSVVGSHDPNNDLPPLSCPGMNRYQSLASYT